MFGYLASNSSAHFQCVTTSRPSVDGAPLTLTSEAAAEAAHLLGAAAVIPVHTEGWTHFTEGPEHLAATFAQAGLTDRLTVLTHGVATTLD